MANIIEMVKQATQMRRQMKEIEGQLARQTVEASSGGDLVKVVARGDMTVERVTIHPRAMEGGRVDQIERHVTAAVNAALAAAKKKASAEVTKLAGGMGLSGLLGG